MAIFTVVQQQSVLFAFILFVNDNLVSLVQKQICHKVLFFFLTIVL